MKTTIYQNIKQGSLEWHQLRYGKVGGTTSDQLHVNSDTLLNELVAARLEPYIHEPGYTSDAMQRGLDLEPEARAELEKRTGEIFTVPGWCESDEIPLIGFSPDGIISSGRVGCEIKCPGPKKHVEYLRSPGQVPKEYIHQCVHMFAVCPEIELLYFMSYRPECVVQVFTVELTRMTSLEMTVNRKKVTMTVGEMAQEKIELARQLEQDVSDVVEKLTF